MSLISDIRNQWVGVVSLMIAVTAIAMSTLRSDVTEENRTIRFAAFEMLKELGSLQQLIHQSHFGEKLPQNYTQST